VLYFDFVYKPYYEDGKVKPVGVLAVGHNVTKQVESRQKFKSVIEQSKDPILILMEEDLVLDTANQALFDLWQVGPEALGKPFLQILPEMESQGFAELLKNVLHTGESFYGNEVPVVFKRKNGLEQTVYFDFSYQPYRNPGGSIAGVLVMATDVTNQVQARTQIEESEQRLFSIINQVNAGIAQTTTQGKFTDVNDRFCQITGYTKEELRERTIKSITHPDDWPRNKELVAKALTEGKNFFIEKRYIRKDGSIVWVNNSVSIVSNSKGEKFITAVSVDITEQITNRQKLEESEERFRSMADASPVMIWTLDEQGNSTYYNSRAAEFTGHKEEELREGKSWQVAIHPDDIEYAGGVVRNAVINRIPYQMECRMQRADGEWRWLLNHGTPRMGKSGEYFGFVGSSIDITERKNTEQALEESESRFRSLADHSPMFVFIIEPDPMAPVNYWNKTWLEYTGQTLEEAKGRAWDGIIHPDDVPLVMDIYVPAFQSRQPYFIPAVRTKRYDGIYRWHAFKGNPRYSADGSFNGYVGVGFDVHEQKITEERLEALVDERTKELANANESLQRINKELQRSNQNLEEFAHAASHDLKEPVRKILFFTNQLKEQLKNQIQESQARAINRIENASQRMGNLIDDLLLYSHVSQQPHETESIDLNKKVQNALEDLELDITEKKAVINLEKLPVVRGYRRQLQQLFQNLISNALKYSKRDVPPHITITASRVTENGKTFHLIAVRDNGIGFEQQFADKIFQMFTRLHGKGEYSGTGVGLSIVKKVVENHNGYIRVKSKPGEGSIFEIYLPV
jgi:PAS domain S-box-containing protein